MPSPARSRSPAPTVDPDTSAVATRAVLPARPFRSAPAAVPDTPHRKRDSSHLDNDGSDVPSHADLGESVFREIEDHVYVNLPAFADAFFGPRVADDALVVRLYDRAVADDHYDPASRAWRAFPALAPTERRVSAWLVDVVNPLLRTVLLPTSSAASAATASLFFPFRPAPTSKASSNFGGGSGVARRVELVVSGLPDAPLPGSTHDWRNVRSFLELKTNPAEDVSKRTIVQIAGYAREVLYAQPTRHAVHAVTLCGTGLRCWFMDRLGLLASTLIDIHQNPLAFLRAALFYTTADAERLGFDPTVTTARRLAQPDAPPRWIHPASSPIYDPTVIAVEDLGRTMLPSIEVPGMAATTGAETGGRVRLVLGARPLFATAGLLTRGSACWRARPLDADHDDWTLAVKTQWRDQAREPEGVLLRRMLGVEGVAQYFSHEDVHLPDRDRDRSPDGDERPGLLVDVCGTVRKNIKLLPEWKRVFHGGNDAKRLKRPPKEDEDEGKGEGGSPRNRVFARLVMSSLGEPLYEFETFSQLLGAFRVCIRGHRALLEREVLHRDISLHNMMLSRNSGAVPGFLIDLDFAANTNRPRASDATHRTGTPPFMAIDVLLQQTPHTYRHDLESFLYVLLWVCTFYTRPAAGPGVVGRRVDSREANAKYLNEWSTGRWGTRAHVKLGQMMSNPFRSLLEEFDPVFQEVGDGAFERLAERWRDILFPAGGGQPAHVPDDHQELYVPLLDALDVALREVSPL